MSQNSPHFFLFALEFLRAAVADVSKAISGLGVRSAKTFDFRLRFIWNFGVILDAINNEVHHEMANGRDRPRLNRFAVFLPAAQSLTGLFEIEAVPLHDKSNEITLTSTSVAAKRSAVNVYREGFLALARVKHAVSEAPSF